MREQGGFQPILRRGFWHRVADTTTPATDPFTFWSWRVILFRHFNNHEAYGGSTFA